MSVWRNTKWYECTPVSPNEKWTHTGGSSMQRKIGIIDGSYRGRLQAAYDFIGYQEVIGDLIGIRTKPYIHRLIPFMYPGLPGNTFNLAPEDQALVDVGFTVAPPDMSRKYFVDAISKTEPVAVSTGIDLNSQPTGTSGGNYQRAHLTLECVTYPFAVITDDALTTLGNSSPGTTVPGEPFAAGGILRVIPPVILTNPDEGRALANGWQYTRYITRQRKPFNTIRKIPYGVMVTNAPTQDGTNIKQTRTALMFREGGEYRSYTWMRVPLSGPAGIPGANFPLIESALGTINSYPFDGCDVGTLCFESMESREYQGAFGEWLTDITFNMIFLPCPSTGARLAFQKANPGKVPPPTQPYPGGPGNLGTVFATKGTLMGWNCVVDIDYEGNWDYYEAFTPKLIGDKTFPGKYAYTYYDFATLFNPLGV